MANFPKIREIWYTDWFVNELENLIFVENKSSVTWMGFEQRPWYFLSQNFGGFEQELWRVGRFEQES